MKLFKYLLTITTIVFSSHVFSMGSISTYAEIIEGKYIEVSVSADCEGCWFNEKASISGNLILKGKSQEIVNIRDSVNIYKGQYNNTNIYIYTIKNPANYHSAVLDLVVSGPGTQSKTIKTTLSVKDSYLAYQKKQNAIKRKENRFNKLLKSRSPQKMYVAAGNFLLDNDEDKAIKLYRTITNRFPDSQWAVKASDKLLNLKFKDDVMNQREQYESNRKYERARDAEQCRERKQSCKMSCGDDYGCYSYCDSICSE